MARCAPACAALRAWKPYKTAATGASSSHVAMSTWVVLEARAVVGAPNSSPGVPRKTWPRGNQYTLPRGRYPLIVSASASSDRGDGGWGREEQRWEREEARWVREERRWEREEERWRRERAQLEMQVESLKGALLDALDLARKGAGAEAVDIEVRLQALGLTSLDKPVPSLSSVSTAQTSLPSTDSPFVLSPGLGGPVSAKTKGAPLTQGGETAAVPQAQVQRAQLPTDSAPSLGSSSSANASASSAVSPSVPVPSTTRTLKTGLEGDDVGEMQNALMLEGFFCGEEDMEYAFFAEGTESAVKTWQATMRVKEDGIMTPELLGLLLGEEVKSELKSEEAPSSALSAAAVQAKDTRSPEPTRERPEIERYARSKMEQGEHRVFLLGENRWEDPARLRSGTPSSAERAPASTASFPSSRGANGVVSMSARASQGGLKLAVKKCFQCRGEGRMSCLECEGTGEMNIEEQFLDWVGEDAKCLHCGGIGAQTCDVCDGKGEVEE